MALNKSVSSHIAVFLGITVDELCLTKTSPLNTQSQPKVNISKNFKVNEACFHFDRFTEAANPEISSSPDFSLL